MNDDIFEIAKRSKQAKLKKEQKKRIRLLTGRWIADNIIAIGALIVAIVALARTF